MHGDRVRIGWVWGDWDGDIELGLEIFMIFNILVRFC